MSGKKKTHEKAPAREPILAALNSSPDVQSVLRLSAVSEPDGHWVIAATVELIDSLPVYLLSHSLDEAKRRVREVTTDTAEIYIEPELIRDRSRADPPTDVIVIKASD
jgi:divalent metal cation (Fe/Co/Zn/Cd) transporter